MATASVVPFRGEASIAHRLREVGFAAGGAHVALGHQVSTLHVAVQLPAVVRGNALGVRVLGEDTAQQEKQKHTVVTKR